MSHDHIVTDQHGDGPLKTGLIVLNRPQVLNALNDQLINELGAALIAFDHDDSIGCIVLTGNDTAFAAGADIAELAGHDFRSAFGSDLIGRNWHTLRQVRKPVIAAVAGFALGGGCELAMMCDSVIAAENARFGQPEIKLGIIPGAGGTQRLPRAVGKAKAMDLVLTGRTMNATEAERAGLVSRVVPLPRLLPEALEMGSQICSLSQASVMVAKEAINRSIEDGLGDGLLFERRLFHALFATADQKEGMAAFVEKRKPAFTQR